MPGALVAPLLVLVEHVNLHWPSCVSQHVAGCQIKGPAGVAGKGVQGSLEPMLEDAPSILAWRIPMNQGAWLAIVHGVTHSQT